MEIIRTMPEIKIAIEIHERATRLSPGRLNLLVKFVKTPDIFFIITSLLHQCIMTVTSLYDGSRRRGSGVSAVSIREHLSI